MSVAYQSLKAPETRFDDDDAFSDDSIQNSPSLENGPQFDPPVASNSDTLLGKYYQDEEYEDEIYGGPEANSSYQQIDGGNPYYNDNNDTLHSGKSYGRDYTTNLTKRDGIRATLSPIIEPPSELMPSQMSEADVGDTSNNSFQNEPLTTNKVGPPSSLRTDDMSPHSNLTFGRVRGSPTRSLISPSFRAPSGGTIISEPSRPHDFHVNRTDNNLYRSSNSEQNIDTGDNDEDTLPFDETTRSSSPGISVNAMRFVNKNNRVMTNNTFENYRRKADLGRGISTSVRRSPSRQSNTSPTREVDITRSNTRIEHNIPEDEEFEDDDEKEQKKKAARLRQEQDARMSLYRQSMMKIIGTATSEGDSEGLSQSSVRALNMDKKVSVDQSGGDDDGDADLLDDIPLSVLQAHNFPKSTRSKTPPVQSINSHSHDDRPINGNHSVRSEPLGRINNEVGNRSSIASSRMMPNVEIPSHRKMHGEPGTPGTPSSQIFGNKNHMLSRGLIGEISREEDMRRRRHTIGYGIDLSNDTPTTHIPKPEPSPSIKDEGLQDKLDLVIQMLAKLTPQNSPLLNSDAPFVNPGIHQRAPSIYSTRSHDNYLNSQQTPQYLNSPGNLGIGQFSPVPFPPPSLPPTFNPESAMNPNESSSFYQRPMSYVGRNPGLNRPSQMRVVNRPADNDEQDDDAQLERIKEEREKLKMKWIQKTEELKEPPVENPEGQIDESFDFKENLTSEPE